MIRIADDAIEYIHSLSRFGKKAGLSNISLMLERLGNPQYDLKFIHVAGTNGKGSVSNMLKNILISHKYKVGYYTSPYIEYFSERICINNDMISDEDLVRYTERVKAVSEDITPIEFEFITAMAFLYFAEQKCDIVVLEVGLGGRFDATNVIDTPLINVITPIGKDHTAILGDTLEQIAFEKAGTIKNGSEVVISPDMNELCIPVIESRCKSTHSTLIVPDNAGSVHFGLPYTTFDYKGESYKLSLPGSYQAGNAVTAIEAALALSKKLPLDISDIKNGLKNSFWKCRFEITGRSPVTVLDGAHNSHGIQALMESVEMYFPNQKRVFLFSMLSEKDWKDSIDMISGKSAHIVVTDVPGYRPSSPEEMCAYLNSLGDSNVYKPDCHEAYRAAVDAAGTDGVVFVFGSLYLAGYLRKEAVALSSQ